MRFAPLRARALRVAPLRSLVSAGFTVDSLTVFGASPRGHMLRRPNLRCKLVGSYGGSQPELLRQRQERE